LRASVWGIWGAARQSPPQILQYELGLVSGIRGTASSCRPCSDVKMVGTRVQVILTAVWAGLVTTLRGIRGRTHGQKKQPDQHDSDSMDTFRKNRRLAGLSGSRFQGGKKFF